MTGQLTREQAYQAMAELGDKVGGGVVVIVVRPEDCHVQLVEPNSERLEELRLLGRKALYALSLYLNQIDAELELSKRPQVTS